ncbi:hypothetical protein BGZ94_003805 [Podila epigama]|nr:hypothetical protein BGZ94_003805 [Podila epigama]
MIDVVMEKEYFGLRRQNEKYQAFDSASGHTLTNGSEVTEQSRGRRRQDALSQEEEQTELDQDHEEAKNNNKLAVTRARLNNRLNRLRGPGIGYDRSEHDRVAFVPMQYNTWLTGAVRWCDGLDLRMRQSADGEGDVTRWEELVLHQRSRNASSSRHSEHREAAPAVLEGIQIDMPKFKAR